MKKFYTIILIAALTVTLGGCNKSSESVIGSDDGADNIINVSRGDEEFERFINTIPGVDIPMPDGSTRRREDIDRLNRNGVITFDFAYVRNPESRFENTFDDPEIFDKETVKFRSEIGTIDNIEWIPVKAGDVLENGLVVESAYTMPVYPYPFRDDLIEFDGVETELTFVGELELEGILYFYPGSEYYGAADSFVRFIPDSTKFALPIPCFGNTEYLTQEYRTAVDISSGNAVLYDSAEFCFGGVNDTGYDFASDTPRLSKARLKLKNVRWLIDCYDADILDCTILQK